MAKEDLKLPPESYRKGTKIENNNNNNNEKEMPD